MAIHRAPENGDPLSCRRRAAEYTWERRHRRISTQLGTSESNVVAHLEEAQSSHVLGATGSIVDTRDAGQRLDPTAR